MDTSIKRGASVGLATMMAFLATSGIAQAAPYSSTEASWSADTPSSVQNFTNLQYNFKVNANDTMGATGVYPELAVNAVVENGAFAYIPKMCIPETSSISADRKTLTCNLGDVTFGTAISVDGAVQANGANGSEVKVTVNGPENSVPLTPVKIVATAGVDVVADAAVTKAVARDATVNIALPVAVTIPIGGEALAEHVEFDVNMRSIAGAGIDTLSEGTCGVRQEVQTVIPLEGSAAQLPPPDTCTITRVDEDTFHVVMDGFRDAYTPQPTANPKGLPMPTDRIWVVGADLNWLSTNDVFLGGRAFTVEAEVENVTATSSSGTPLTDIDTGNQKASFNYGTDAGGYYAGWQYNQTILKGQGGSWTGAGLVMPGDTIISGTLDSVNKGVKSEQPSPQGLCNVIDTYSTSLIDPTPENMDSRIWSQGAPVTVEYYTSPIDNIMTFKCDDDGKTWTRVEPTDVSTITAVRYVWDNSQADPSNKRYFDSAWLSQPLMVKDNGPGTDVWMASSLFRDGNWISASDAAQVKPVTDARYPLITKSSDVVYIDKFRTVLSKTASTDNVMVGDEVTYTLEGAINASGETTGVLDTDLNDILPVGATYIEGSASVAPTTVTVNPDGTTTLYWDQQLTLNTMKSITYKAKIVGNGNESSFKNNASLVNQAPGVDPASVGATAKSSATVVVPTQGRTELVKSVESPEFAVNGSNIWNLSVTNYDSRPQALVDVVDVLPYNGDGRGTSYVGDYTIGDVITDAQKATVYYTSASPETLSVDPGASSNGAFGSPSAIWTTTKPEKVTGIRVIAENVPAGTTVKTLIPWTTHNAADTNKYFNLAASRATTTALEMIKASTSTMLDESSSLQVDKIAQDDLVLTAGGKAVYVLTVRNSGAGAANDVKVTDIPMANLDSATAQITEPSMGSASGAVWSIPVLEPGQQATALVTVNVVDNADLTAATTNMVIVENPSNPVNPDPSSCISNVDVVSDTDQCDMYSLEIGDPQVQIVKKINGDDANTAPGVVTKSGDTMNITYDVTNKGNIPLSSVVVTDDKVDSAAISCPKDTLLVGETMQCTATLKAPAPGIQHTNMGTVTAVGDLPNGKHTGTVTAIDPANAMTPIDATITIVKTINGDDANEAPGVMVDAGSDMAIVFDVTNNGNSRLTDVKVTDDVMGDITCPKTELAAGESMKCEATLKAPSEGGKLHTNTATVTGVDPSGKTVTDLDKANATTKKDEPSPTPTPTPEPKPSETPIPTVNPTPTQTPAPKPGIVTGGDPTTTGAVGIVFTMAAVAGGAMAARRKFNNE